MSPRRLLWGQGAPSGLAVGVFPHPPLQTGRDSFPSSGFPG